MTQPISRRTFNASVAATFVGVSVGASRRGTETPVGPMVGHVSSTSAVLWYRPAETGRFSLLARAGEAAPEVRVDANSEDVNDRCVTWRLEGLKPATRYQYSIRAESQELLGGPGYTFETAPADGSQTRVCLAFGSCARTEPLSLWTQIGESEAQGLVLLGDTPYIDSTKLETARKKHRAFLSIPQLAAVVQRMPVWGTWDDHDFGANDSDGRLAGKEQNRRAFIEYRANESYGEGDQGIYTKFRYGPVEVFLLDARWFSRTEPSPVDPDKPTLLGRRQWEWLLESLRKSTAPFKMIASGMIWDDKRNGESDDWGTYSHERDALFDFLGKARISGVTLIGGDIHCSRLLRYKTEQQVGYPVHQFIVSPIHGGTIPSLNVAHPDLIEGEPVPNVWLRLEVDSTQQPATLHAQWVQMDGRKMWDVTLTEEQLRKA
ncbi:MAG: alkaline phosphatase D family protein [Planctomycetota bacterium]|nr:alkaline phosphatase D family protein [Planctomycetota bacterium]